MARYKRYRHGGRTVPGMFKAEEGGEGNGERPNMPEESLVEQPALPANQSTDSIPMNAQNAILQQQKMQQQYALQMQKMKMLQQQKMQEMLMQMKLQNEQLNTQNTLLSTKIEKLDAINSARTVKPGPGAKNTPKRRGGSVMKKGGSCLPGGRYSKKRK
jgi:hypothetical protein